MALQFVVPFVIIGISYRSIWSFLNARRIVRERAVETTKEEFVKAIPFLRRKIPTNGRVRVVTG
uniref:ABC transporter permease n=1 Tax=Heterorhabditis bacteriophora TaxID=37862 RepID=A0A1I7WUC7_HETBA